MCSMLILYIFNMYVRENWCDISLIILKRNHILQIRNSSYIRLLFFAFSTRKRSEICREITFYLKRIRKLSTCSKDMDLYM